MSQDEIIATYQELIRNDNLQNEIQAIEFSNDYISKLFDKKDELLKICDIEESIFY